MSRSRGATVDAEDAEEHVLIVSGSVGAGHDGAAEELCVRLRQAGVRAEVRDYLDALPDWCGFVLRRGYVGSLRYRPGVYHWIFHSVERRRWARWLVDGLCRLAHRRVSRWVADSAVVVSTYPLASQTLGQLKLRGRLDVPLVTFLTDPAPHRLWVHPAVDCHITVMEATARMGRRDYAVPMVPVGGLVASGFSAPVRSTDRKSLRASLGLPATAPVALLMAGSEGMGDVPSTAAAVSASGVAWMVVLCGRNERLRRQLSGLPRIVAVGWRSDVADLMAAADVLVHNAGGLSLTEAMAAGLPAVTYRPIPGHGQANALVLELAGLVPWPKDDAELIATILRQCEQSRHQPGAFDRHRDASAFVRALLNRDGSAASVTQSFVASSGSSSVGSILVGATED